ncbi:hypothetical protein [Aquimarina rhabdastrellae]
MNQSLHKLLMTVLLVCSISIIAQEKEVEFSKSFEIQVGEGYDKTARNFKNVFEYEGKIVVFNRKDDDLILNKYNSETLKIEESVIEKKFFDKRIDRIKQLGDKIVLFYNKWDKKNKIESLEIQMISLETLSIEESKVIIKNEGKIRRDRYAYEITEDESKFLIFYGIKNKDKKDKRNLKRIHVFDKELTVLREQDVVMPFSYRDQFEQDIMIDANNNFYAIVSIRNNGEHKKEISFYHKILILKEGSEEVKIYEIDSKEEYIANLNFYEDEASNIYVLGSLKDKNKVIEDEAIGTTAIGIVKLNENGIEDFKSFKLSSDVFDKNKTWIDSKNRKKYNRKNTLGFLNLGLSKIVIDADGDLVILGEEVYSTNSSVNGSVHFFYKDIFAAKINKDNGVIWMKRLPKRQSGANRGEGGMSFSYLSYQDKHYLLFLDNVKNMNLIDGQVPHLHLDRSGGYLTAYIIDDKTGNVEKESIFNTRKFKGTQIEKIRTSDIVRLSDSEMVIEGYDGEGKDFLVKVSVKK